MAVRHLDSGVWPTEEPYPSAPPPSPEVPVRNFDCLFPVAERLLDELSSRAALCSPIPSIEISGRKESINDFSGSFSNSSSSSFVNGDCEDTPSMDVEEGSGGGQYNGDMPGHIIASTTTDNHATHVSTIYPIPNGIGGIANHIPHSWHQGLEPVGSHSPPKHKSLSHSFSYNCTSDGGKTRRRSFSKRKQEDKVSCIPVEESPIGQDSMECEMTGKKSCQQSVIIQGNHYSSVLQYQPSVSSWLSQTAQPAHNEINQYLQPPNPLSYGDPTSSSSPHSGSHRLSEPLFGSNVFDSSISRSL